MPPTPMMTMSFIADLTYLISSTDLSISGAPLKPPFPIDSILAVEVLRFVKPIVKVFWLAALCPEVLSGLGY